MNRFSFYAKSLKDDLPSSIVVFLVAIPLCLGIAMGTGLPLLSGLVAGIIGGIVTGALSGSHLSISGPAAGLITIITAALIKLPAPEAIFLSVMIAGILQLILGFIGAGIIGDYVPRAVVKGMLASIGLILILKEIPHLLGYDADYIGDQEFFQNDSENTFSELFQALKHVSPTATIVGLGSLLLLFAWEYLTENRPKLKNIPGPALVIVLAVVVNQLLLAYYPSNAIPNEHLLQVPVSNSASEFFSHLQFPEWSYLSSKQVWFFGITLALVASLESLLSIEAIDTLDPYKRVTPTNRELKAQGVSNLLSGFFGGLPITSVIVRSSANLNAGAKSRVSSIMHGILILAFVLFFASVLNIIPIACLAALLIHTGYKLAKPSLFKKFYQKGWDQFLPMIITVMAILLTDLLYGVLIGIASGLFFVLRSNFHSAIFVMQDKNNYLFRLRKDVSFLNKPILRKKLEEVPPNSFVLIDLTKADFIDQDIRAVIDDFSQHAALSNIQLEIEDKPQ